MLGTDCSKASAENVQWKDLFGTYEGLDALQNKVAGDVAWKVLAKLCDQFGVALILLP